MSAGAHLTGHPLAARHLPGRAPLRRGAVVLAGVAVLWGFLLLGDLVSKELALPLPGSIVGMVALWGALETGLIRLSWVDRGAGVLIAALGLLFVPAGVGIVEFRHAGLLWLAAGGVVCVGLLVSLAVTGHVVQAGVRRHR